jgi:hypothetical protein
MTTLTFDTHTYVKKLKAAGVSEKQAEVHAEVLTELISDQLITKQYLDLRLNELEIRLKHDLTLRLGGMLVAGIAVVAALVKLL